MDEDLNSTLTGARLAFEAEEPPAQVTNGTLPEGGIMLNDLFLRPASTTVTLLRAAWQSWSRGEDNSYVQLSINS